MTIVVVSHDLASMQTIADYVVVLGGGRTLFKGQKDELLETKEPYLRQFLDRESEEREAPRLTMAPLDPSVMKMDCAKYIGDLNSN
ncbi:ATP-binding cassette domain-containing protein [Aduncisulcus paluster]|uniref:ATP-binding cassette domain-containing protein n=1 Tax=Aduncisulcus paluster TaxID=2918883 RepID=A0ABQ5K9S7_9EUKA|nr:ATP-binding cassette domain-containing protein [Aduncisulcus paluster]